MNEKNLIPLNQRSKKVQREIQEKGRKAAALKREEMKTIQAQMQALLDCDTTDPETGEKIKVRQRISKAQIDKAFAGDTAAFLAIWKAAGEGNASVNVNVAQVVQQSPEERYNQVYGNIEDAEMLNPDNEEDEGEK